MGAQASRIHFETRAMAHSPETGDLGGQTRSAPAGALPADGREPLTTPDGGSASSIPGDTRREADLPDRLGAYRVEAAIGQGGMGVVYRVHDPHLNRALAVKVLLLAHKDNAELCQRFLEEAHVMGQLQHLGVPPIHELGTLEDGRPFFAMKQVKGRTLSALLREKSDRDLPRFLQIFAQVCQTIAYAHSHGIIHRDLKPSNIMVGAFGEVQVMDWGLAKVVAARDDSPGPPPIESHGTSTIFALRGADSGHTASGTVLGTPAYMPPEQARGEVESLDERSDVFGLGAMLCELLTGRPPFSATSKEESFRRARQSALDDARAWLDASGADADLVQLAKQCLAPDMEKRPPNAGAVAAALARYEASVQERLRRAELDQAAAEATAREQRKRRRVSQALACVAMLLVVALAGAAIWYVRDQADRDRRRQELDAALVSQLTQVDRLRDALQARLADPADASRLLGNVSDWSADVERLRAAWQQSAVTWQAGHDVLDPARAGQVRAADEQVAAAEKELAWATSLDQVRQDASVAVEGNLNRKLAADRYRVLFPRMGFDVSNGDAAELADAIGRSPIRHVIVAALDYWAGSLAADAEPAPRLMRVAMLADPDPWRDQVRDTNAWTDQARLKELADRAALETNPQTVILLARRMQQTDQKIALIRRALVHHPRDFWLHFELARLTRDPAVRAAAYRAALALRPNAIAAHNNLGTALAALKDYDGAVKHFKKCLELDAQYVHAHNNLGSAVYDQRDYDAAITHYEAAIRLQPQFAPAHSNLGVALYARRKVAEAIRSIERAIEIDPDYAAAHVARGNILRHEQKLDAAIEAYNKAIAIDRQSLGAHTAVAVALTDRRDLVDAVAACRRALDIDPRHAPAHAQLGTALYQKKDFDGSLLHFKLAVEYDPDNAVAQHGLGAALSAKGDNAGAVAAFRKAIALMPNYALAQQNLVVALRDAGRFAEVLEHLPTAVKLASPATAPLLTQLGKDCERQRSLDQKLSAMPAGQSQPADPAEAIELGYLCGHYKKRPLAACRFYASAFAADPQQKNYRNCYNAACYAALALAAKGDDAQHLDADQITLLRQLALDWLQTALAECRDQYRAGAPKQDDIRRKMLHWQTDADLIAVRDAAELGRMPENQFGDWQRLWNAVNALRR
jgi:serine/threonine protein kinase/Tfp pilus assembly protein PilF